MDDVAQWLSSKIYCAHTHTHTHTWNKLYLFIYLEGWKENDTECLKEFSM